MYKIDGFQGNQASVVIVDLVVDKKIGFLNELNRINVVLSCALHGWYVIVNFTAFETEQYKWVNWFYMKMVSHFKQARMFYKVEEMSQYGGEWVVWDAVNWVGDNDGGAEGDWETGVVAEEEGEEEENSGVGWEAAVVAPDGNDTTTIIITSTDDNNTGTDVVVDAAAVAAGVSEMNNNDDADNVSSVAAPIHSINNNTGVVLDNTINSLNAASDVIGNSITIIIIIIIISDAASATQVISQWNSFASGRGSRNGQ
ncbi:hypothetical protein ACJ72_07133 [Emergomyces africanus]|uniref:DNA2/NAM7 helicase-like C-terminal domain-containing protein n=1 Tax=Emergomyces africanus TaxID=1955775 RepID=A0A1B7NP39_9EURO|nr:hypothetical protein ACJ72_07133 [Emergomyces africanus]